ncbi:Gfo/Idh/MocA family oxidoreductase [Luteimonas sp. RD2P54]|uniref:Gfo/Idh/MocA family oxidoreductase n=1 Tax=Luteimonas endophytica TaxID=3042023 RepID=A0ABT6JA18_9GAMM|nr:Gfo/Idh/MocA family oxidoreductase [Luteimonas endophytica]MDH5823665.1 Gfo/Idh/MocA family oxidoreductase [Luteimonas endophytica]
MDKLTRRRFLGQTTAAIAAAPFVSTGATRARAQESRRLGFAICGLGRLSEGQIAPAFARTRHCRLAGLVTGTPAKAEAYMAKYGVPADSVYSYKTMHRMADNPEIDVVYVVTPNALHARDTLAAAAAGKHVFCEKPLEISVERCQRMIDACAGAGRMLGTAYRCRYDPHHLECIRLVREREFGAPLVIEAGFGIDVGEPGQWRLQRALAGGGALMDVGIYALQATRYLTGTEPLAVSAMQTRTDPVKFAEVDESMVWTASFPDGVVAHCSTSYKAAGIQHMRVNAERGWFELDPAFFYNGNHGRRSDGREIRFPEIDLFAAEMDDFARCILEGRPSMVSGEEGLRDVRIMQAIYASARTGTRVELA